MIRPDTLPADRVAFSGGCLRFDPKSGPYIHHNYVHNTVGVQETPTYDNRGRLHVKHAAPGPIITMGAWPDESLVARGVTLGCSGGVGTTIIVVAQYGRQLDLRRADDYKLIAGPYCNAWLFWLHDVSS